MTSFVACFAGFTAISLLSCVFLPSARDQTSRLSIKRVAVLLSGLNAIAAVGAAGWQLLNGPLHSVLFRLSDNSPVSFSLLIDGPSTLMWCLVGGVGWIITGFSVRYLDGEEQQERYFRWTAFTLGSVTLVVIGGNLLLILAALLLTSIGLHQLLVHYSDRKPAQRAATIKFVFSRLGDVCLLVAGVLLYRAFGTVELPELFAILGSLSESALGNSEPLSVAGCLLVLCAVFKSAQFPFHTWLPETMEAPTPVSALMHAGIVNAGGYLLIRTAPIVSLTPAALWAAAGVGAFTAVYAATVMLSQTSVKRALAWSTIAQMGFMILQCGLGAFSAAMLHIIAHSLYKAYAFLNSGNVLAEHFAMATATAPRRSATVRTGALLLAAVVTAALFAGVSFAFGSSPASKPGGVLLSFVLCLAMTRWMWQSLLNGPAHILSGVAFTVVLLTMYVAGFTAVDKFLAGSAYNAATVALTENLLLTVAGSFLILLPLEAFSSYARHSEFLRTLYVHSSNGFYIDALWRRVGQSFNS